MQVPPPQSHMPKGLAPERLGRYRLVRPISTGGMARVFEARRESLAGVSPRVAIKVILPDFATDAAFQQLFVNEARIGSQLQHQNLVGIQDFDREGEHFYLVMEFVEGITMRRIIGLARRHGLLLPLSVIVEMARQVCEGLQYLHGATAEDGSPLALVHRDIKPSNIMLNAQGVVKVLDFGISKALFSRERVGSVKGTWGYMSPEQAEGTEVGPLADLFGLAAVIYELATLQPLFPEKEPADIRRLLAHDEAARRSAALGGVYGALAPILIRALQRDPMARFSSAQEFGRALGVLVPDPSLARDYLQSFYRDSLQLQEEGPGAASVKSWSTLSHGASQANSAVSFVSSASSYASQGGMPGLPLAVGAAPPGVELGLHVEEEPVAPRRSYKWSFLMLLVALAVMGFTIYRFVTPLRAPETGSTPPAARYTLGSLVEDGGIQPTAPPEASATRPTAKVSANRKASTAAVGSPAATPAPVASRPDPAVEAPAWISPVVAPATTVAPVVEPVAVPATTGDDSQAAPKNDVDTGFLTISSIPRAQVILDGQFVRWVPLFQHSVSPGNHVVTLITEDGQRQTFRVTVAAGEEVRRIWQFERGTWAD